MKSDQTYNNDTGETTLGDTFRKSVPPQYVFHVLRADNQLVAFLNGATIYEITTEGDPIMHDRTDITDKLNPHPYPNVITIQGFNGTGSRTSENPWFFEYYITKDGKDVVGVKDRHEASDGPGLKLDNKHTIVKERP